MSLYVVKKLNFCGPTTLSLHMVNQSLSYPQGILEEVLVKVDKFIFQIDFVVLEMEENIKFLIILGSPFLVIEQALIM